MTAESWFRRLVGACIVVIFVLWMAGIAHFRDTSLSVMETLSLIALGFVLMSMTRRMRRRRPMPPLPKGANPVMLAAVAAGVVSVLAAFFGGVFEWLVQSYQPSSMSWGLRTTWHAACAFGICYCSFLLRLTAKPAVPPAS